MIRRAVVLVASFGCATDNNLMVGNEVSQALGCPRSTVANYGGSISLFSA
jgi:hypothetical protein